jgi:hypothetical protein
MKEWRVTNRTQGRLEIKDIRKVLDPGESVTVAEPLPESIKYLLGGRQVTVEELAPAVRQVKPSPAKSEPAIEPPVERSTRKKSTAE